MSPAAFLSHGTGVRIPVPVPTFAHDSREGCPPKLVGIQASEGGLPVRSQRASVGKPSFAYGSGEGGLTPQSQRAHFTDRRRMSTVARTTSVPRAKVDCHTFLRIRTARDHRLTTAVSPFRVGIR